MRKLAIALCFLFTTLFCQAAQQSVYITKQDRDNIKNIQDGTNLWNRAVVTNGTEKFVLDDNGVTVSNISIQSVSVNGTNITKRVENAVTNDQDYVRFQKINLNTNAHNGLNPGDMAWDHDEQTVSIKLNSQVRGSVFLEDYVNVTNTTDQTLSNGYAICIADDVDGKSVAMPITSTNVACLNARKGLLTESIPPYGYGRATERGDVHDLDTLRFNENDFLYATKTPWVYTNVPPPFPEYPIVLGRVSTVDATGGVVKVHAVNIQRETQTLIGTFYGYGSKASDWTYDSGAKVLSNGFETGTSYNTITISGATNNQVLARFITDPSRITAISGGQNSDLDIWAEVSKAGNEVGGIMFRLRMVTTTGELVSYFDSVVTALDQSQITRKITCPILTNMVFTSQIRIMVEIIAKHGATDRTYTLYSEDGRPLILSVPLPSQQFAFKSELDNYVLKASGTAANLALTGNPTLNGTNIGPILTSAVTNGDSRLIVFNGPLEINSSAKVWGGIGSPGIGDPLSHSFFQAQAGGFSIFLNPIGNWYDVPKTYDFGVETFGISNNVVIKGTNTALALSSTSGDVLLNGVNYGPRIVNSITNGQVGPIILDYTTSFHDQIVDAFYIKGRYSIEDINLSSISPITGQGNAVFFRGWKDDWSGNIIRMILRGNGDVEIPNGSLDVSQTNTANVLRSTSGDLYLGGQNYGPRIVNSITNGQADVTLHILGVYDELMITDGGNIAKFWPTAFYSPYGYAFTYWTGSAVADALQWSLGDVSIPNGSLDVSQTNTAGYFSTTNTYGIGPLIGGKQSVFFGDGTNSYQVDVNLKTNVVVSSAIGTNQVSYLWKGSNSEFQTLSEIKSDTLYAVTDDQTVFDTKGIYSKVETYNVLTGPAETEIVLVEGKSVYDVNVYTNAVIKFNAEGLNFSEKEAEFKLVFHITETNIPSLTFAEGIQFAQTPEYTVTGKYENVVSTRDGTNYLIRQTYPTIYEWHTMAMQNLPASTSSSIYWYMTPKPDIFYFVYTTVRNVNDGLDYEIYVPPYCTSAYVPDTFVIRRFGNHSGSRVKVVSCFSMYRYTSADLYAGGANSHDFPVRKVGSTDTEYHIVNQWRRFANELEIKAYNSGWRP